MNARTWWGAGLLLLLFGALFLMWWGRGEERGRARRSAETSHASGATPDPVRARPLKPNQTAAELGEGGTGEGVPTDSVGARTVRLAVERHDGSPAQGVLIGLAGSDETSEFQRTTGVDGRIEFDGLSDEFVNLAVVHDDERYQFEWIGRVDLRKADANIRYRLIKPWKLDVRLVGSQGNFGFDESYLPGLIVGSLEWDEKTGRLTGTVIPPLGVEAFPLVLKSLDVTFVDVELPYPPSEGVWSHDVPFNGPREVGQLKVAYDPPENGPQLVLARVPAEFGGPYTMLKDEHFGGAGIDLHIGEYVVVGFRSYLVYGRAQVKANNTTTLRIDASRMEPLTCVVDAPEGWNPRVGEVWIEGVDEETGTPFDARLEYDKETRLFRCMVKPSARYRVTVQDRRLAPDPERGSYEGTGGGKQIRLRLVEGPKARLTVPRGTPRPLYIHLFEPGSDRRARFEPAVRRDTGGWSFTGHAAGTYDAYIRFGDGRIKRLQRVALSAAGTDLGVVAPAEGSTLTLAVKVDEPYVAPELRVLVSAKDSLLRPRLEFETDRPRLEIPQLSSGDYDVDVYVGPIEIECHVTIEEGKDAEMVIDLRSRER